MSNDQWGPTGAPNDPNVGASGNQPQADPWGQNPPSDPYGQGLGTTPPPSGAGQPRPRVSFQEAITLFFKNYAIFNGRASRSEFWWVSLFLLLVDIVLNAINSLGGGTPSDPTTLYSILSPVWALATLVPGLALAARRLHDTNRSGWWQLLALIPVIGWIILIVFLVQEPRPEAWQRYDNGKLPCTP